MSATKPMTPAPSIRILSRLFWSTEIWWTFPAAFQGRNVAAKVVKRSKFVLPIYLGSKCTYCTNLKEFEVPIYLGSQTYPSLEPAGPGPSATRRQGS